MRFRFRSGTGSVHAQLWLSSGPALWWKGSVLHTSTSSQSTLRCSTCACFGPERGRLVAKPRVWPCPGGVGEKPLLASIDTSRSPSSPSRIFARGFEAFVRYLQETHRWFPSHRYLLGTHRNLEYSEGRLEYSIERWGKGIGRGGRERRRRAWRWTSANVRRKRERRWRRIRK